MSTFPPLESSKEVYRTVLRKEWIRKDGSFKWQVFKPYRTDKDGISVFIEPKDIEEHSETPYFGIASVNVGRVRECSASPALDVIQDKTWHANITGVPYPYNDDETEDETLKTKMIELCEALANKASQPYNP